LILKLTYKDHCMTRSLALVYFLLVFFSFREACSETGASESAVPASTDSGTRLFMAPDESSAVIETLTKSHEISPLAFTLVAEGIRWYLVKTKTGAIGWLRQSDSDESKQLDKFFKALPPEVSLPISLDASPSPSAASGRSAITVPVETNGSWIIVPVTFNGAVKARLQLDTGASSTMVSRRIANDLALSPLGARRAVTVGGTITLSVARVRSLKVGAAEIRDLVVAIHDFSADPRVEGLLGLDFLKHFHVSLDARRKLLILGPP
jgi:predicted aspartyl protease